MTPVTHMESNLIPRWHRKTTYYDHSLCFILHSVIAEWTLSSILWNAVSRYWLGIFFNSKQSWNLYTHGKPINPLNPVPDAAHFQWAALVVSTEDSPHYLWIIHALIVACTARENTGAFIQILMRRHKEKRKNED